MKFLSRLFKQPKPEAEQDINQYISDLVEQGNQSPDLSEFYRRLGTMELHGKIISADCPLENGARHTVGAGQKMEMLSGRLPSGQRVAQFFVDKTDARLRPQFCSMSWREACEMVLKVEDLDGLAVCNSKIAYIAVFKPELQRLLRDGLA